jgi:1-acyl-sn-glycerol-3-phosphate acyltransferase
MIRFIFLNVFIGLHTLVFCLWCILLSLFDKDGSKAHRLCAKPWARTILFMCGVKLDVRGIENLDKIAPQIFMSNHQSYFDIFALLAGLPANFKFILKKELMRIPMFGIAMKRAGYIAIDRGDRKKAIVSINRAADRIRNGASVLIFPEGTRSKDGTVQAFKHGGFHLAMRSGCNIIPVAILKSRDIVPKGSLKVNKGTIYLKIGKPISVTDYSKKDMNPLIEMTRNAVIGMMAGENN